MEEFTLLLEHPEAETTIQQRVLLAEMLVNNFSFSAKDYYHTLSENAKSTLLSISLSWIDYWAKVPEYHFDDRNQLAVERCKALTNYIFFNNDLEICSWSDDFAEASISMHRTLMQSFSSLLFLCLEDKFHLSYSSWQMPLI